MSSGLALETEGAQGGRWKRYPAYKDSGVEWLGAVPEGWEVLPLKWLGGFQAGAGFPEAEQGIEDEELPFYKVSDMNLKGNEIFMKVHNNSVSRETATNLRAHILPPETIIFAKVGAALLLNRRRILTTPSCIDNNTMGFTKGSCDLKWLYYWMCGIDLGELANPGAVPAVNESQMQRLYVPVPTLPEQRAIAAFLDRETGRIDALIAKKERQIELLREKRAALISHAVTKGLDPDAPMKDSGVEWLGAVPEGWEVMKLRRICRVQQGLQIAQANRYAEPGPNRFEYITVKSIHADDTLISKEYIEKPPQSVLCASDDILLARTGATGEVFSDQIGVFHNNFFKVIYDRKLVDKNYLIYYLSDITIKKHLIMLAGTTTIPDLNHGDFLDMPFSYPSFGEQKNIVTFLDRETARITNPTNKIRESITKLHEYRTALISAAVTGKIDVRGEET
ncbi:MAG: hypothetical protein GQ567_03735 [Methanosarcinales archaeon]|nr:hypothetical protein [Methanosarcinales archaeon]